jgi:uncharacterized damage-inducible protein DinB
MMVADLGPFAFLPDLVEFAFWGDLQVMQAAMELPVEEYTKERGFSFGSLHKLLLHAMGAEWVWLNRFRGTALSLPTEETIPTREVLATRWPEVHAEFRKFVAEQTQESMQKVISFRTFAGEAKSGRLGDLMMHVTDHATYHRGQQNTFLKLAGHPRAPLRVFYYTWRIELPA